MTKVRSLWSTSSLYVLRDPTPRDEPVSYFHEARKAIQEAEQTRRLTLLAFFYLPLTFTTSVFGMNIRDLRQGDKSIWIAFVTGFVVLTLSVINYSWQ